MAVTITNLTDLPSVADNDEIPIYDVSAGSNHTKKVTRANLVAGLVRDGGDASLDEVEINDLTATVASLAFNSTSVITDLLADQVNVTHADIADGASETVAVAVTGVTTADYLTGWAFTAAAPDGVIVQAWISAADTVSFRFTNLSGSLVSGATHAARVVVLTVA